MDRPSVIRLRDSLAAALRTNPSATIKISARMVYELTLEVDRLDMASRKSTLADLGGRSPFDVFADIFMK